ncbi:hypothetical protein [Actinophytocola xanthii]|uniref:hypothetical protein n=1 Tax=Actinophytocola xanthii TaxID=1912961 RepID=UPI0011788FA0|nr:hypothetical protein [Actinophytocola xanthii]
MFEPSVGLLGVLGGLGGLLAERRATRQERRQTVLFTLRDELDRVTAILNSREFTSYLDRRRVFPRLPLSAVDAALISGAFSERADAELLSLLHRWQDETTGFNRRLEITEMHLFAVPGPVDDSIAEFTCALRGSGGYHDRIKHRLTELQQILAKMTAKPTKLSSWLRGRPSPSVEL